MSVEYRCDRCGTVQEVNDGLLAFYQLEDGRGFCHHGTGWCHRCRELSDVEEIPDPEDLRRRLAEQDRWAAIHRVDLEGKDRHLQTLLDWSLARRHPPRCLWCGGIEIIPLERNHPDFSSSLAEEGPDGPRPFHHPGCGGLFRFKDHHFDQLVGICLTAEGEPIDFRWEGRIGRWIRHLIDAIDRRFARTDDAEGRIRPGRV